MKIAVLGSRGIPNRYGGFEEMAERVCPLWVSAGHHVTVYAVSDHPEKLKKLEGVDITHIFNPEKTFGLAGQFIYDLRCILDAKQKDFDIILQLGYTTSGLWSFLWPKQKTVTNMDGLEHTRAKYKGPLALFLRWSERRAATRSKLLVADNPIIADYLNKYKTPCRTIAYGAEIIGSANTELLQRVGLPTKDYVLHIGRVQSDNHVKEILESAKASGKILIAIGDYSTTYGKKLYKKYQTCENIIFPGNIYEKDVVNALRKNCDAYLHGHSAGGTNPALLEAMGCGAFVLAHGNPYNASVLGGLGGLWDGTEELTAMLENLPNNEIRAEQSALAQARVKEHFNWPKIAKDYLKAFQSI
ncbi:MAG TPA: glycosyltransferase family 1 protein [Cryomorphaceae bacterium]|nr:glycosyltransferase family 1 protein [Cryomorphaceae bacterium]